MDRIYQQLVDRPIDTDDALGKIADFAWRQRKFLDGALNLEDVPCAAVEAFMAGDISSGIRTTMDYLEAEEDLVKQIFTKDRELLPNDKMQLLRMMMVASLVLLEHNLVAFQMLTQFEASEEEILRRKERVSEELLLLKIGQCYGQLLAYHNLLSHGAKLVESHIRSKARTRGSRPGYDMTDDNIAIMLREAKKLHQEGMKQNAIAVEFNKNRDKYGLSQQSVRNWNKYLLIHRQEWKI